MSNAGVIKPRKTWTLEEKLVTGETTAAVRLSAPCGLYIGAYLQDALSVS